VAQQSEMELLSQRSRWPAGPCDADAAAPRVGLNPKRDAHSFSRDDRAGSREGMSMAWTARRLSTSGKTAVTSGLSNCRLAQVVGVSRIAACRRHLLAD
jgi:hypothetical protein